MLRPFRGSAAALPRSSGGLRRRTGDATARLPEQYHRDVGPVRSPRRRLATSQRSYRPSARNYVAPTGSAHRCAREYSDRTRIRPGLPPIFNSPRTTNADVNHDTGVGRSPRRYAGPPGSQNRLAGRSSEPGRPSRTIHVTTAPEIFASGSLSQSTAGTRPPAMLSPLALPRVLQYPPRPAVIRVCHHQPAGNGADAAIHDAGVMVQEHRLDPCVTQQYRKK